MKKILISILLICTVLCTTGCSPYFSNNILWIKNFVGDSVSFELDVNTKSNTGIALFMKVRKEEKFISQVMSLDGYFGKISFWDTEQIAHTIFRDGHAYSIYKSDSKNADYCLTISHLSIKFIEDSGYYKLYFPIGKDNYIPLDSTKTISHDRKWEYYTQFYKNIIDTTINETDKTITTPLSSRYKLSGSIIITFSETTLSFEETITQPKQTL